MKSLSKSNTCQIIKLSPESNQYLQGDIALSVYRFHSVHRLIQLASIVILSATGFHTQTIIFFIDRQFILRRIVNWTHLQWMFFFSPNFYAIKKLIKKLDSNEVRFKIVLFRNNGKTFDLNLNLNETKTVIIQEKKPIHSSIQFE